MIGIANKPNGYNEKDISILEPFLATCSTLIKAYQNNIKKQTAEKEAVLIKEEFTKRLEVKVNERTKELEEAQKKLALSLEKEKELGELKSRFVAIASHQFRTPLTVIQSSMGVLALQTDDMNDKLSSNFDRIYNRIERQIGKMTSLMNQVLILGKIDTLNVQTKLVPTDLVALCKEIMINHNAIQVDGRRLTFIVNGAPYKIKLDTKLMEDAISNLISNAFKYSINRPAPSLTINFGKEEIQLSIKDSGIGIPPKDLKHLLNPFFRASNVTGLPGTGLGTAIAKEYVELNGGTISVTSKLNKGSEFTITLKKDMK